MSKTPRTDYAVSGDSNDVAARLHEECERLETELSASTAALAVAETKLREIREYASRNTDQWARDVYALASNPNHP